MRAEEVATAVRAALARAVGVPPDELNAGDGLYEDLGADSLAVMELLGELEEDLGIDLPSSTAFAAGLRTVGDVVEAFRSRAG